MITLKLTLLILAALGNALTALIVLARDLRKFNILSFAFLLLSVGGWAAGIAGFLATDTASTALVWAKIYYAFPILIGLALSLFVQSFPTGNSRVLRTFWSRFVIVAALASLVPLVVLPHYLTDSVRYHDWGKEVVLGHAAYWLYSFYILLTFSVSIGIIYWKIRKLYGLFVEQARLFTLSFLIASTFGVIFNLILPGLGNYQLIWIGPLFTAVLTTGVAISISRHKMFDVRLAVARSLGYAASIIVLASIYGFVVFGIAQYGFHLHLSVLAQISLAAATGFSGLIFPHLRKLFDRLTNQLFYRDAYDPQQLFSQLNSMLVTSLDVHYLVRQSISIVETALKPEFAMIGLRDGDTSQRLFGTKKLNFSQDTIMRVRKLTPRIHHKVIAADYLEDSRYNELRDMMRDNNVSIIVRLTQDVRRTEEGLGYLVLGPRKSGNPYTQQDIRVLDTVANELIIAIQNALHYEEIQQFNQVLQARVDEATRKLRSTNEKLKALDETKDDFISMASHQLRTPLTSVKGYLSMVLEGDAGKINETQKKMLGQAFISSQRMVYLIADLLNVSRLRTGKFIIEPAPTNLATIIEEELAQLVETAAARDIELKYTKPKEFPELMLDETKTRQVIMNFVDNAIYYTPAGGHITVEVVASDRTVELRVVDDGIGVPKAEQHHLFTKFYRAGNARKARPDGTGLGLYMAKKVVVAQGGIIIFESKEGKGSTFGFSFPRQKLAAKPAPMASVEPIAVTEAPTP